MKPFLVAIAGPSGSGKSHLARALHGRIGSESCALISLDSYYKDLSHLPMEERELVNFDHPSAMDSERLAADLGRLSSGQPARIPVYDFASHTRSPEEVVVEPKPILIIEGLFALAMEPASSPFGLRIYVETDVETCLARRLARDVTERGRDEASVREAFDRFVRPSLASFVEPQKARADLVLDGTKPESGLVKSCLDRLPPTGQ